MHVAMGWMEVHGELVGWLIAISAVMFAASVIAVLAPREDSRRLLRARQGTRDTICRAPPTVSPRTAARPSERRRRRSRARGDRDALLPGQGVLTILAGVLLHFRESTS